MNESISKQGNHTEILDQKQMHCGCKGTLMSLPDTLWYGDRCYLCGSKSWQQTSILQMRKWSQINQVCEPVHTDSSQGAGHEVWTDFAHFKEPLPFSYCFCYDYIVIKLIIFKISNGSNFSLYIYIFFWGATPIVCGNAQARDGTHATTTTWATAVTAPDPWTLGHQGTPSFKNFTF